MTKIVAARMMYDTTTKGDKVDEEEESDADAVDADEDDEAEGEAEGAYSDESNIDEGAAAADLRGAGFARRCCSCCC